jgi:hypothetical protein
MKKLVLFGLVISLLAPGCSDDSGDTGAGDGDAGWDSDGDAGAYSDEPGADPDEAGAEDGVGDGVGDGDPGTDRAADGGGQVDCQFDPAVEWWIIGEILQMESADQGTCVWLSRTNLCPAGWICKAIPFSLDEVRIGHDGQVREYDSSNATLTWTPSHHNWEDSGTIDTGTTVFTLAAIASEYGHAYNITASGGETWGPILLEPWVP